MLELLLSLVLASVWSWISPVSARHFLDTFRLSFHTLHWIQDERTYQAYCLVILRGLRCLYILEPVYCQYNDLVDHASKPQVYSYASDGVCVDSVRLRGLLCLSSYAYRSLPSTLKTTPDRSS
jgi:hypothetical protein